jgi:hypothetical protein
MRAFLISLVSLSGAIIACNASATTVIRSASGANAAAIQNEVEKFRTDLGVLNANVANTFPTGRREVNWDGVPDQFDSPNAFPANFFNSNSPRGVVFKTDGTGFQNSSNTASGIPVRFGNINPAYTTEFSTFSPQRLFTPIGSTQMDVNFFLPGSATQATTRGFGVVFTDVDVGGSASIELFSGALSLGDFKAPVFAGDGGLSFIGVSFDDARVTSVHIISGTAALGAGVNESLPGKDLVVMDDFIYGEPAPVPAPGAIGLASAALALVAGRRRRA